MSFFEFVFFQIHKQLQPIYPTVFGHYDEEGYPIEEESWEHSNSQEDHDNFYNDDTFTNLE